VLCANQLVLVFAVSVVRVIVCYANQLVLVFVGSVVFVAVVFVAVVVGCFWNESESGFVLRAGKQHEDHR